MNNKNYEINFLLFVFTLHQFLHYIQHKLTAQALFFHKTA